MSPTPRCGRWPGCRSAVAGSDRLLSFHFVGLQEALPGWRGRKLEQPSLDAHLADPTLLPPAAAATSKEQPYITCFDPSTNEHIATVPADTASTIDDKVRAAGRAQKAWTRSSFGQRRTVMRSLMRWVTADMAEISRVGMRDTGKTGSDFSLRLDCRLRRATDAPHFSPRAHRQCSTLASARFLRRAQSLTFVRPRCIICTSGVVD